jgi:multiple antibiotic resistance protein
VNNLTSVTNAFLLVFAGLFPIVNPVGNSPIFLRLTQAVAGERQALARAVAFNGFFLLLGSLIIGSHVLEFFGISLPVVRIGGGLVVTAFGWKLLNSETPDGSRADTATVKTVPESFYPLTMPLTVGPGSISVAISLGSQRPKGEDWAEWIQAGGAALAGVLAIVITIYLCYRFAQKLVGILGPSGTHVVVRLSAFILVCIGIQILWSGWSELMALHP